MGFIVNTLQRGSSCAICRDVLSPGTVVSRWNNRNRPVCQTCVPSLPTLSISTADGPTGRTDRPRFVTGEPGRSCKQQVSVDDLARMVEMAGRGERSLDTGQLRFAANWHEGARSESIVGAAINVEINGACGVALHDRRADRGNIDHIIVTNHGIAVVDTKTAQGKVHRHADRSLSVSEVDYSRKLDYVAVLASQVETAIGQWAADIEIAPMLCLVHADWASTRPPFEVDSVSVVPVGQVVERLAHRATTKGRQPMNDDLVTFLGLELATRFPAA
jgi:Nuclease-related domain